MSEMERLISRMLVLPDSVGRPLEELMKTHEILSGVESQRLRTFFSNNHMEPSRDLDSYGWAVMYGDIDELKARYAVSLAKCRSLCHSEDATRSSAAQEIYRKRWGPTHVPVFNLVLLATIIYGGKRTQQLQIARWLIDEVKVLIDGVDLSGSTALHHAISTKPSFDSEYAQMLYDAGGIVTNRNRYGGTPAHEITLIWDARNKDVVRQAADALKWFLEHGGNLDIKDSDGKTAREIVNTSKGHATRGVRMETWKVVEDEDKRRGRLTGQICTFCAREPRSGVKLLVCSRCKIATYYSPGLPCQKADWPHHKRTCKNPAV